MCWWSSGGPLIIRAVEWVDMGPGGWVCGSTLVGVWVNMGVCVSGSIGVCGWVDISDTISSMPSQFSKVTCTCHSIAIANYINTNIVNAHWRRTFRN